MRIILLIILSFGTAARAEIPVSDSIVNASNITQTQEIVRSVEVAKDTFEEYANINTSLTETIDDVQNIVDGLQDTRHMIENATRTVGRMTDSQGNVLSRRNIRDTRRMLDMIWGTSPGTRNINRPEIDLFQQTASKASLETSEFVVADTEEKMVQLGDLVQDIDDQDLAKLAIDHNNKILAERLRVHIETKNMLAKYIRMRSAEKYSGVDSEMTEIKQQELMSDQLARGARNAYGMRVESCPDVMKRLNQC